MDGIIPWGAINEGVTNTVNFATQHLTNVKNRKFTREMYKTQRGDALADWAMTNEYNSPRAQMQRFQEAGLNPNLIYGQMQEAGGPRSSSASGGSAEAPKMDPNSLQRIYDTQRTSAQADLVAKQMSLMEADIELRKNQSIATIASANLTDAQKENLLFDLGFKQDTRSTDLESKQWNLTKLKTEQNKLQVEVNQMSQMFPKQLQKAIADIAMTEAHTAQSKKQVEEVGEKIKIMKSQQFVEALNAELAKQGIRPTDSVPYRLLKKAYDKTIEYFKGKGLPLTGQ